MGSLPTVIELVIQSQLGKNLSLEGLWKAKTMVDNAARTERRFTKLNIEIAGLIQVLEDHEGLIDTLPVMRTNPLAGIEDILLHCHEVSRKQLARGRVDAAFLNQGDIEAACTALEREVAKQREMIMLAVELISGERLARVEETQHRAAHVQLEQGVILQQTFEVVTSLDARLRVFQASQQRLSKEAAESIHQVDAPVEVGLPLTRAGSVLSELSENTLDVLNLDAPAPKRLGRRWEPLLRGVHEITGDQLDLFDADLQKKKVTNLVCIGANDEVEWDSSHWVGIEVGEIGALMGEEEELAWTDGEVDGRTYFELSKAGNRGLFVRPDQEQSSCNVVEAAEAEKEPKRVGIFEHYRNGIRAMFRREGSVVNTDLRRTVKANRLLRQLQAANEGYLHAIQRVLENTYGIRGRTKHSLLEPFISDNPPTLKHPASAVTRTILSSPLLSHIPLQSFVAPLPPRADPTSEDSRLLGPLIPQRVKAIQKRWWKTTRRRLGGLVEVTDTAGEFTKSEGALRRIQKRAKAITPKKPRRLQSVEERRGKVEVEEHGTRGGWQGERRILLSRGSKQWSPPHAMTPRFIRRRYDNLLAKSRVLVRDVEEKKGEGEGRAKGVDEGKWSVVRSDFERGQKGRIGDLGEEEAIYSALLSHAQQQQQASSTVAAPALVKLAAAATPTAASTTASLGSDANSEAIYSALLANAASSSSPTTSSSSDARPNLANLAVASSNSTGSSEVGFLSSSIEGLATPVPSLVGAVLILLSLFILVAGSRSLNWLNRWGKPKVTLEEGKAYIAGGVAGLVFGGVFTGILGALLTVIVIGDQTSPSLSGWGVLAILVCATPFGAVLGGRYRWAARALMGVLGGLSLTLMLCTTFKLLAILPRLVILAIFVSLSILVALLPATIRSLSILAASTGAYLFILGIDTFTSLGLLDAISLLVADNGVGTKGKATSVVVDCTANGLIAAWWIVFAIAAAWQWWWWGREHTEDPDEAWKSYLGSFVLPKPESNRSFFSRIFSRSPRSSSALTDMPGGFSRRRKHPWDDEEKAQGSSDWDSDADTLGGRSVAPAKYGKAWKDAWKEKEEEEEGMMEEETRERMTIWRPDGAIERREEDVVVRFRKEESEKPDLRRLETKDSFGGFSGFSGDTLVRTASAESDDEDDGDLGKGRDEKKTLGGTMRGMFSTASKPARYVGVGRTRSQESEGNDMHSRPRALDSDLVAASRPTMSPTPTTQAPISHPSSQSRSDDVPAVSFVPASLPLPEHAVPVTPSLIHALERINAAQRRARGENSEEVEGPPAPRKELIPVRGVERKRGYSWDQWWGEVLDKEKGERK
ncbi:hypothetical protein MNV49_003710 [Pseudohyphozyma bogoriensis]|nr:hypothetical protein MNV49_003710 [Pseudohyphozyma bogoriensis]